MLIAYSIKAFEVLERPLTEAECAEITTVFCRMGQRMGIPDLPTSYPAWRAARAQHLAQDMAASAYTTDLYRQYRKHLGGPRYYLLRAIQGRVVPPTVRELLELPSGAWLRPALAFYGQTKYWPASQWARNALLPAAYLDRIKALDAAPAAYAEPGEAAAIPLRCPVRHQASRSPTR